ncbi:SUKH-4 family immunity protein [Streptomyces sp. NPDC059881]|uniref:SUKH-4 family immunity protein n=1 Tax=Streptomyces sp. NPDC059881 TaxID=3346986 RepID=UPI00365DA303
MIFELSTHELDRIFGEEHVKRVPLDGAAAVGITGETLSFLTEIGLPKNQFITFPDFETPRAAFRDVSLEELGSTWHLPDSAENWIVLGNFEISAIVLDTHSGEVHQLAEGIMRPIPLHGDISSLVKTIAALTALTAALPDDYEDDEEALEALEEDLENLKRTISARDERPFAHENSEWVEVFTSIGAGMWG